MKCAFSVVAVVLWLVPSVVVGQPVIQNTSLVRVRADNHFGVVKDSPPRTPSFPLAVTDTITDTEIGTAATATTSATYDIALTPAGARIGVARTDHSYSVGSHANLTEGFIQFTTAEPYVYEVTGALTGASGDTADAFQLRAFLRQFQPPFATAYLEDETGFGSAVSLAINGVRDSGVSAIYNQSGGRVGMLLPGTYEFAYELESRENDQDFATSSTASGSIRLELRKLAPPTSLSAQTSGNTVGMFWTGNPDATSYHVEVGSGSGAANLFSGDVGNITSIVSPAPTGVYYVRVRSSRGGVLSAPSNEVAFGVGNGGCIVPPPPPAGHAAQTGNLTLALSWSAAPGAISYALEAGTAAGLANLFNANVGSTTGLSGAVPAGTYFTRVRAVNGCGTSAASNEVQFTVSCNAPAAPANLAFSKAGGILTVTWSASPGAATYRLQAGTSSGASNLANGDVGSGTTLQFNVAGAPPGTYFARLVASNACGTSGVSNEIAIPLP